MKISFLVPGFVGRFPSAPIRGFQSKTTVITSRRLRSYSQSALLGSHSLFKTKEENLKCSVLLIYSVLTPPAASHSKGQGESALKACSLLLPA